MAADRGCNARLSNLKSGAKILVACDHVSTVRPRRTHERGLVNHVRLIRRRPSYRAEARRRKNKSAEDCRPQSRSDWLARITSRCTNVPNPFRAANSQED